MGLCYLKGRPNVKGVVSHLYSECQGSMNFKKFSMKQKLKGPKIFDGDKVTTDLVKMTSFKQFFYHSINLFK